jgi:hypothetical protein
MVRRGAHIVDDTLEVMGGWTAARWRQGVLVHFDGEVGIDCGALTREWAKLLCQQLLRPGRGLFRRTAKGNRCVVLADQAPPLASAPAPAPAPACPPGAFALAASRASSALAPPPRAGADGGGFGGAQESELAHGESTEGIYTFVGRFVAFCLWRGIRVDAVLTPFMLRLIMDPNARASAEDLYEVDPKLHANLTMMLTCDREMIEDTFCQYVPIG